MEPAGVVAGTICKVCGTNFARYTCPRCCTRYCGLACYKSHGERCTEGFSRDNAVAELKDRRASASDRKAMQEILTRLHAQEDGDPAAAQSRDGDSSDSDGAVDDPDDPFAGVSEGTLQAIVTDADFDVAALPAAEQRALEQALARVNVASLLPPWEPWWLSREASQIRLRADGTRMVALVQGPAAGSKQWPPAASLLQPPGKTPRAAPLASASARDAAEARVSASRSDGQVSGGIGAMSASVGSGHSPPDGVATVTARVTAAQNNQELSAGPSAGALGAAQPEPLQQSARLPQPPDTAVPAVQQLCSGEPAPQLRFVVLQLVCAYCYAQRSYAGDSTSDLAGCLQLLWRLCPHITAVGEELPSDAPAAMLAVAERLRSPPINERSVDDSMHVLVQDCTAVLRAGRGALVCLLADVGRLHCAALAAGLPDDGGGSVRSERKALDAAASRAQRPPSANGGKGVSKPMQPAGHSDAGAHPAPGRSKVVPRRRPSERLTSARKSHVQLIKAVRKLVFLTSVAAHESDEALQEQAEALATYLRDMDSVRRSGDVAVR